MLWAFLISGAIQAGSSIMAGASKAAADSQNARLLEDQAQISRKQGMMTKNAYDEQARSLTDEGGKYLGSTAAQLSSAGVKRDEGTPLYILRKSQKNIQTDISKTRTLGNYALSAGASKAEFDMTRAKNLNKSTGSTIFSGFASATSSLLGTFANSSPYTELW